jgi:hypothetical protein
MVASQHEQQEKRSACLPLFFLGDRLPCIGDPLRLCSHMRPLFVLVRLVTDTRSKHYHEQNQGQPATVMQNSTSQKRSAMKLSKYVLLTPRANIHTHLNGLRQ